MEPIRTKTIGDVTVSLREDGPNRVNVEITGQPAKPFDRRSASAGTYFNGVVKGLETAEERKGMKEAMPELFEPEEGANTIRTRNIGGITVTTKQDKYAVTVEVTGRGTTMFGSNDAGHSAAANYFNGVVEGLEALCTLTARKAAAEPAEPAEPADRTAEIKGLIARVFPPNSYNYQRASDIFLDVLATTHDDAEGDVEPEPKEYAVTVEVTGRGTTMFGRGDAGHSAAANYFNGVVEGLEAAVVIRPYPSIPPKALKQLRGTFEAFLSAVDEDLDLADGPHISMDVAEEGLFVNIRNDLRQFEIVASTRAIEPIEYTGTVTALKRIDPGTALVKVDWDEGTPGGAPEPSQHLEELGGWYYCGEHIVGPFPGPFRVRTGLMEEFVYDLPPEDEPKVEAITFPDTPQQRAEQLASMKPGPERQQYKALTFGVPGGLGLTSAMEAGKAMHAEVEKEVTAVHALRFIRAVSDYHRVDGNHPPNTVADNQCFDDWVADYIDSVIGESKAPRLTSLLRCSFEQFIGCVEDDVEATEDMGEEYALSANLVASLIHTISDDIEDADGFPTDVATALLSGD